MCGDVNNCLCAQRVQRFKSRFGLWGLNFVLLPAAFSNILDRRAELKVLKHPNENQRADEQFTFNLFLSQKPSHLNKKKKLI